MSEKRSWDIQPNRRPQTQQQAAPSPVREDRRISLPRRAPKAPKPSKPQKAKRRPEPAPQPPSRKIIRREQVKQGREREPLKAQRRRARRRMTLILSILFVLLVAVIFAALWSPLFRIQHVVAGGPDSTGVEAMVLPSLSGSYEYVLPRNSIFFFPQDSLRAEILAQFPDISAVEISRSSFDTITINSIPRESAFLWCGTTYVPSGTAATPIVPISATSTSTPSITTPVQSPCYDADSQGDIFALDTNSDSGTLRVYDSLASTTEPVVSPLGQHVAEANMIPNALNFVKEIKSLDVPVVALVIRSDEADLYAQSGTRITYVLGTEETSTELAVSAFPSLNLNDGSLQYVDLRFAGKVYFKKFDASTAGTSATSTYSSAVSCYLAGKCQIH
jgi:hypothetical protein